MGDELALLLLFPDLGLSPGIEQRFPEPSLFRHHRALLISVFGRFFRHGCLLWVLAHFHHFALQLTSLLKIINIVHGTCCAGPNHKNAMMMLSQNAHLLVSVLEESASDSATFLEAVCEAAEVSVVNDRLVESGAVLVDHLELVVLGACEEGSVMLMRMKHGLTPFSPEHFVHRSVEGDSRNVWTMRLSSQLVDPGRWSKNFSTISA